MQIGCTYYADKTFRCRINELSVVDSAAPRRAARRQRSIENPYRFRYTLNLFIFRISTETLGGIKWRNDKVVRSPSLSIGTRIRWKTNLRSSYMPAFVYLGILNEYYKARIHATFFFCYSITVQLLERTSLELIRIKASWRKSDEYNFNPIFISFPWMLSAARERDG